MKKDRGKAGEELARHPGLYRAKLNCGIGRDVLDGKTAPPDGVSATEWALFCLLHAVEEIAEAMMPPVPDEGVEKAALGASWLMEAFEDMVRQHCHTAKVDRDYNGQVAGSKVTDSGGLSSDAEALRFLAGLGKFRIVAEHGRMVVGYWPENDPEKKNAIGEARRDGTPPQQ